MTKKICFIIIIIDKQTLCNAKQWIKDVKASNSDEISIVLIGNKIDTRETNETNDENVNTENTTENAEHAEDAEKVDNASTDSVTSVDSKNSDKTLKIPKIKVTREMGAKLATDLNVSFYEVSAKTGENVDEMFEQIVRNYGKENIEINTNKTKSLVYINLF